MISKDRIEELETCFWNETNDEETEEWREYLNDEEIKLVNEWDKNVNKGMVTLCQEILKHKKDKV